MSVPTCCGACPHFFASDLGQFCGHPDRLGEHPKRKPADPFELHTYTREKAPPAWCPIRLRVPEVKP